MVLLDSALNECERRGIIDKDHKCIIRKKERSTSYKLLKQNTGYSDDELHALIELAMVDDDVKQARS